MSVASYNINDIDYGYLGRPTKYPADHTVILIEDKLVRIHKITPYRFSVTDPFAPAAIAEDMLENWCNSEQGIWVMTHAIESPIWHRQVDALQSCLTYAVTARLTEQHYTFYQIKWA